MESCPEFVFATLALNKLGAIWVPINIDYKGQWLGETLQDSRARLLLADAVLLPRVAAVCEGAPLEQVLVRGEGGGGELSLPHRPLTDLESYDAVEPDDSELRYSDTAAVMWTSGTTGRSKGVMQSHNSWICGSLFGAQSIGVRDGDVLYSCLPMYNSAAWVTSIFRSLLMGVPCGLDAQFSASEFWDRCRHFGATMVFTLGAMHIFLWRAPPRENDADNPVRVAEMIPMPENLLGPFRERFGLDAIYQGYGQSEMLGMARRSDDGTRTWKPNSMGLPLSGLDLRILDEDDREVVVGEVGEICVRPLEPYLLFNGYFDNPDATLASFRNLWYHTGDLGRRDDDGEMFFVDRKADYIRYKGRNISSFAVEAAITAHPDVVAAAAFGIASSELESEAEMMAAVVLAPNAGEVGAEDIARFVNETAPYFFIPRYIEFVDELPQTPTGKIQKYKLRERGVTADVWDSVAAEFKAVR